MDQIDAEEIELISSNDHLQLTKPHNDDESPQERSAGTKSPLHHASDTLLGETKEKRKRTSSWYSRLFPTHLLTPVVSSILIMETAERFSYFGFRAVLVLFFTNDLYFDETQAISYFAYTTCLAFFSPVLGAAVAESTQLGRYGTILRFGTMYAVGLAILTTAACLGQDSDLQDDNDGDTEAEDIYRAHGVDDSLRTLFWKRLLTLIGLIMVCIGTGGIKPLVSIFGADQVALRDHVDNPQQEQQRRQDRIQRQSEQDDGNCNDDDDADEHVVREFYNFFYFCINVGALTSFFTIPIVKHHFGFGAAFLLPTCFMVFAITLFYSKRKAYVYRDKGQQSSQLVTTFRICFQLICSRIQAKATTTSAWLQRGTTTTTSSWATYSAATASSRPPRHELLSQQEDDSERSQNIATSQAHDTHNIDSSDLFQDEHEEDPSTPPSKQQQSWAQQQLQQNQVALEDAHQALQVLPVMAMLPMFWMLYDQQGSVWTLQASRMALHGLEPEQLNMLNPLQIMIFIPLFDRIIYPAMERRNWNIAPLRRMGWGMVLAALSFVVSGVLEHVIEFSSKTESIHVLWQVPQITIMAVGEIFLSVTGLEYAYSSSPDRLKGFIMATYLLMEAIGDLLGGILYSSIFKHMNRAMVTYVCAALMLLNWFVFRLVVKATQQDKATTNTTAPSTPVVADGNDSSGHAAVSISKHSSDGEADNTSPNASMSRHSSDGSMVMVGGSSTSSAGTSLGDASSLGGGSVEEDWMDLELPKIQVI